MFFIFKSYKILRELKFRLFYCLICFILNFICLFLFSEEVIFLLTFCFLDDLGYFINTGILENFYISFYVSIFLNFLVIFPFILIHFWFFIVEGLYRYENKIILFLLFFYIFILLFLFLNNFFISFIWNFFKNYNLILHWKIFPIFLELSLLNLINLIFNFIFLLLLIFLFPLFLILLFCYNLLNLNFFLLYRKFFYIIIYIIVCIFCIPDFFSQFFSFSFIIFLFELILFLFLLVKYKK